MTSNPEAPSSFWNPNPPPVGEIPSPTPASFYTQTSAFNLVYYGALATAPVVDPFGNTLLVGALYYDTVKQALYVWNGATWNPYAPGGASLDFVMSNGALVIQTGTVLYRVIPYASRVTGWTLLADVSGSCVLDVQRCSYAQYGPPTHPASGDSIAPSNKPTLTAQIKNQATSLNWSNLNAGDILALSVTSASSVHQLYIQLNLLRL